MRSVSPVMRGMWNVSSPPVGSNSRIAATSLGLPGPGGMAAFDPVPAPPQAAYSVAPSVAIAARLRAMRSIYTRRGAVGLRKMSGFAREVEHRRMPRALLLPGPLLREVVLVLERDGQVVHMSRLGGWQVGAADERE